MWKGHRENGEKGKAQNRVRGRVNPAKARHMYVWECHSEAPHFVKENSIRDKK